jgi:NAD-dependent deacetylase
VSSDLNAVAARIRAAKRVAVLTGAGVSAASGVPTFRGAHGLWKQKRPEDLATPEAFRRDPRLVWEWYDWRRRTIAGCAPNAAHEVLARWSRVLPSFALITQNVDGLHERAGTARTIRLHGSIWDLQCWSRCAGSPPRWHDDTTPLARIPPTCPFCGGLARPGVVWFGEALDPDALARAEAAARADVFLAVGTSAVVYPAAALASQAKACGAFTVEVNLASTPASGEMDVALRGPAEAVLAELEALVVHSGG